MPFVKIDTRILDSSIWCESVDTRLCWIVMLVMADPEGLVASTAPGIARRAGLSLEVTRQALEILEAPDPDSKSQENEGRRIRRIDGGYVILNFKRYRAHDYSMSPEAIRKREWRERQGQGVGDIKRDIVPPCPGRSASVYASESESSSPRKKRLRTENPSFFEVFWKAYPRKRAKPDALQVWTHIEPQPDQELLDKMLRALAWQQQQKQWIKDNGEFIPYPATWLNRRSWEDERQAADFPAETADNSSWETLNDARIAGLRQKIKEWERHEQDGDMDPLSTKQLVQWRAELKDLEEVMEPLEEVNTEN